MLFTKIFVTSMLALQNQNYFEFENKVKPFETCRPKNVYQSIHTHNTSIFKEHYYVQ